VIAGILGLVKYCNIHAGTNGSDLPPDQSLFINGEEDKRFLKYQAIDKDELYQVGNC
jgi:hypothetical protein